MSNDFSMPPDWDDSDYLRRNPDVARAVALKQFSTGWQHYLNFGQEEGRKPSRIPASSHGKTSILTRDCLDPWHYLEIAPSNGIKPCCNIPPIAAWEPNGLSIIDLRNSEPFQLLRKQLLTGDLSDNCRKCHIRPMVPLVNLQDSIRAAFGLLPTENEVQAQPLSEFRIEVTRKCNLRCVYCAVSQPDYFAPEMDASSFDDIVAFVSKQPRDLKIYVNGHGETTFHPDWLRLCNAIVGQGFCPIIITNLARPLNADEAACLAGFREIQVSLDTVDAVQLAKIRRRMKLSNVLQNIHMIRRAATAAQQTPPMFAISCGVYDANYAQLESLPEFCASVGISGVTFWQLTKYDDLVGVQNVYPITSLDKSAIAEAIRSVERTIGSLHQHGIPASVAGEFLDEWRKMVLEVGTP